MTVRFKKLSDDELESFWRGNTLFLRGAIESRNRHPRKQEALEEWRNTIAFLDTIHPMYKNVLLASLIAPIVAILRIPGLVVNVHGSTTTGKSKALRLAESAWRRPGAWSPIGKYATGAARADAMEQISMTSVGCPIIIDNGDEDSDESQNAEVANEVCRVGSVLIVASERSMRQDGSLALLNHPDQVLWNPSSMISDRAILERIDAMMFVMERNYGFVGPSIIQYLVDNMDEWNTIRAEYEALPSHGSKSRHAFDVGAKVVKRILGIPWDASESSMIENTKLIQIPPGFELGPVVDGVQTVVGTEELVQMAMGLRQHFEGPPIRYTLAGAWKWRERMLSMLEAKTVDAGEG